MFEHRSVVWSRLAFSALGSAVATAMAVTTLAVVPVNTVEAQSLPACATAWSAGTVYNGGDSASENGTNYKANWWTQGNDPATNSGGSGSGQPWTSQGACSGSGGSTGGGGTNPPPPPPPPPLGSLLFSPYKDVTINLDWNTNTMRTAVTGTPIPVVGSGSLVSTALPNLGAITLAFASGECGSETWGGISASGFASANIQPLANAGIRYVLSTGGQAGTFTCGSPAGMAAFLARYNSSYLTGVDFDIEGGQTQTQINNLISNAAYAHTLYPNLRFSFTLATLAASDGSYGGVNSLGDMVVRAVKAANLPNYTINLMVMDYGSSAASYLCVVTAGKCNMGQSAIQAVQNLEHTYGIPANRIEVTPMIGQNDAASEITTIADVDTITAYANAQGLAGVHYWSLDRDTPCPGGATGYASPTCNSITGTTALQYTKRFLSDLGH
jgi:chitinase